jgi:hypothetical protein
MEIKAMVCSSGFSRYPVKLRVEVRYRNQDLPRQDINTRYMAHLLI